MNPSNPYQFQFHGGNGMPLRIFNNLSSVNVSIENLTAAFSAIKDADIAEELADLTKQQLLVQSAAAMVGQANLVPDGVLLLLTQ